MTTDQHVAVVGLGYVGLPLAISFVEAGHQVDGIDAYAGRVAELNAGSSPIDDVTNERLVQALGSGLRVLSPGEADLGAADAIFVCVPTPITTTKDPDLAPVLAAAETISGGIRKGQLIVLQSTTYPGTTTGPFREVLERGGLKAGQDFDLAFAPERVNPGDPASASKAIPRLVGATTPAATKRAAALLATINDNVIEMSSPDAAELSKLLGQVTETVYDTLPKDAAGLSAAGVSELLAAARAALSPALQKSLVEVATALSAADQTSTEETALLAQIRAAFGA